MTQNARKDDNGYGAWIGLSSSDGVTPVRIQIEPTMGGMKIDAVTTIGFSPATVAGTDNNAQHTRTGISTVDGVVVPLFVNPATGAVLIDSI